MEPDAMEPDAMEPDMERCVTDLAAMEGGTMSGATTWLKSRSLTGGPTESTSICDWVIAVSDDTVEVKQPELLEVRPSTNGWCTRVISSDSSSIFSLTALGRLALPRTSSFFLK